jgi:hypothetical protein
MFSIRTSLPKAAQSTAVHSAGRTMRDGCDIGGISNA